MAKKRRRSRKPRWIMGYAALGALLVATVALSAIALTAEPPVAASRESVTLTSADFSNESDPWVTIIGDSYSAGTTFDSGVRSRWPRLLRDSLPIRFTVEAAGGNGYNLADPRNFSTLARGTHPESSIVILFGSLNDQEGYDSTAPGVRATIEGVRSRAANAQIVMIGPPSPTLAFGEEIPDELYASRDAVRDVANEIGAIFVDPLELQWFADRPDLIAPDRIHPNDAGHAYMFDQIKPIIEPLIPAQTTP